MEGLIFSPYFSPPPILKESSYFVPSDKTKAL